MNYNEMEKDEAIQRLMAIRDLISSSMSQPMLTTTYDLLNSIKHIAEGKDIPEHGISDPMEEKKTHVILSCDASIKVNPGGPSAVGFVIEYKDEEPIALSMPSKATTCNQAEYDAIYMGLTTLLNLKNNPNCMIEIRSDSRLVVGQLNGKMQCNIPELIKRRDAILELIKSLPFPVSIDWRPRNSTPFLKKANNIAQDALGVKNH